MIYEILSLRDQSTVNSVIDMIPASIYCKSLDGVYLNINQYSLDMMKLHGFVSQDATKEAIVGKTDFDLFSESIAGQFRAHDYETIRDLSVACFEEGIRSVTGVLFPQLSTKRPLLDGQGKVLGVIGATIIPVAKSVRISKLNQLTERESACLELYLQGKTSKESARILGISFRTVEWHMENLKIKLNCSSKRDLLNLR